MRWLRAAIVLAVMLLAAGVRADGPAPGKEVARKLFEEGIELEKKSDFPGALAKYQEAEQITVTAGLHFHVAFCLEMTSKLAGALDAYESALKLARDQSKPEVEKAVRARLEPLRGRVPTLGVRLVTQADGAVVEVDGVSLAPVLLGGRAFRVDPGDHTVTAHASGYAPFTKTAQAAPGAAVNVDVVLEADAPAARARAGAGPGAAPTTAGPPAEPPRAPSRALPIAFGTGAAASLVLGVVFYALAGSEQNNAQSTCPEKTTCDSERKKVRTFDAVALGGFVGAAGLGALAVITWTTGGTRVVASPTSIRLEGRF
jgi:hypothetical protein